MQRAILGCLLLQALWGCASKPPQVVVVDSRGYPYQSVTPVAMGLQPSAQAVTVLQAAPMTVSPPIPAPVVWPSTSAPRGPDPMIVQVAPCPVCPIARPLEPRTMPIPVLDLNTAPVGDLEKLPWIDLETARAIDRFRPFQSTQELVTKRILSLGVYQAIEPYIRVTP